jgi:hypothetical protein
MSTILFNGRPDGLGNRIEQLIFLEAYCIKNNCKINYYWENKYTFRTYKNLFICKNIIIQDKIKHKIDNLKIKSDDFSKEELYNATKNITLSYNLPKLDYEYIAVHIRAGDKLNNRGKDEFTLDFLKMNFNKCINIINNLSSENINIVICSEDIFLKNELIKNLNKNIIVKNPYETIDLNDEYKDFYKLVNAKEIFMVPKFSSYAATACLFGNNILNSFVNENESSLYRYKCNVNYIE